MQIGIPIAVVRVIQCQTVATGAFQWSRRAPSKRFRVDRLENAIQKGFAQPAGAFNNHHVLETAVALLLQLIIG
jgi:hypothetical protein